MPTATRKLLRILPPVLALAVLGSVCAWEVDRIAARAQGYGDKQVVLNEICAHNLSGLQDGNGAYGDWIELYNPCGGTIDLSGWTLTDDKNDPDRWTFPAGTVLDEYLLLFADGTDTVDPAGYLHTVFRLKTDGETLYLYDADGELVDYLKYPEQDFDITYGRAFGNGEDAGTFGTATPGAANPANFLNEYREKPLGTAEFSLPAGFYEEPVQVSLTADDPDALIFYTTDGSDPAENGKLYTGPIEVESRAGEANRYASLPVSFGFDLYHYREWLANYAYHYAPDPVDKATTVTVRLYKDGAWSDQTVAATYWIGVEPHTLPVVSVTTDAEELFGKEGIYVPGFTYFTRVQTGTTGANGNFLSGERIDASVQILDGQDTSSRQAQISVGGNFTRSMSQLKNIDVNVQGENGTDFLQGGTTDDLTKFTLKGPGNGVWPQFYLDAFWNDYLYDTDLGAQYNIPVVLYLEDEYWGVYSFRERKNAEFIARRFALDPDSLEVYTIQSRREDVTALGEAIEAQPVTEQGWQWFNEQFDLEQYIRYLIAHMYANNGDGIHGMGNNMILWRATEGEQAPYNDGRWRFLLADFDETMREEPQDPIADLLGLDPASNNIQLLLFQKLWQYPQFREQFAQQLREELATTYAPENILPAFEAWCAALEPELPRNIARQSVERTWLAPLADWLMWSEAEVITTTEEGWQQDYDMLCHYLTVRAEDMLSYLDKHLQAAT